MAEPRSHIAQLLAPLADYGRVRFKGKAVSHFWAPLVCGVVSFGAWLSFPTLVLVGEKGLLDITSQLVAMLVGFYVAALGVMLGLQDPFLDEVSESSPSLDGKKLTWRDFLVLLFGYLLALALLSYAGIVIGMVAGTHVRALLPAPIVSCVKASCAAVYTFALSRLFLVTMFGAFLGGQRIQEARNLWKIQQSRETPPKTR